MTQDPIVCSVVKLLQERSERGMRKYKTTLAREDLSMRDWIEHARDEMLDGALYLQRMLAESDRAKDALLQVVQDLDEFLKHSRFQDDEIRSIADRAAEALGED